MPKTRILSPNKTGISEAAGLLRAGQLVAFPTETVYGLGADATSDHAVARIFEAKERPQFNPLIAHVPDLEVAQKIAHFNDMAHRLAKAFWPGPLTLVLPLNSAAGISPLVTAGLDSVALRIPEHPVAQNLLHAFHGPIAAPSANPSGQISPTQAQHVMDGLKDRITAIIDGGACGVGVESTIISLTGQPTLLRPGGIPGDAFETCLGMPLSEPGTSSRPTAPGQLTSHYAPRVKLRLNADTAGSGETLLGFGKTKDQAALNLSESADLTEAAANLFHFLRTLDAQGKPIAVSPIPNRGLGHAINDRLQRAAAPRP